jgi:aspartyl-tRNA(Asn)/glutamyl-tRNA(Gln) amidotransferase subunit B
MVDELARDLPELPDEKKAHFIKAGLSAYDASVWSQRRKPPIISRAMVAAGAEPKAAVNWLNNEYFGRLNKAGFAISAGPISPQAARRYRADGLDKVISSRGAKDLTDIVWHEGGDPRVIVESRGLKQVSDESAIEAAVAA